MSCFHPKLAYCLWNPVAFKYHVFFARNSSGIPISSDSGCDVDSEFRLRASAIRGDSARHPLDRFVSIPCGKCIGCLNDKANDWSKRIQIEAAPFPGKVWFLTLTYSDPFLPWSSAGELVDGAPVADLITGEVKKETFLPSLRKRDLIVFLKNIRNHFGPGVRFFACGEYSPRGRPHYHVIIFNLDLSGTDDLGRGLLEPYGEEGSNYFTCDVVSRCWRPQREDPDHRPFDVMGQVLVVPYEPATGKYVAKYLIKAREYSDHSDFFDLREKPFLHMSRNPGLGRDYFDRKKSRLSAVGSVSLSSPRGAYSSSLPRYFQRLLRSDPEFAAQLIEEKKRLSDLRSFSLSSASDLSFLDRMSSGEEHAKDLYRRRKEL